VQRQEAGEVVLGRCGAVEVLWEGAGMEVWCGEVCSGKGSGGGRHTAEFTQEGSEGRVGGR